MKQMITFIMEGYQTRLKGLHLLTNSKAVELLVKILKPIFREKIRQRIHIHMSLDTLHEHISKDCLPEEFGGEEKSLFSLHVNRSPYTHIVVGAGTAGSVITHRLAELPGVKMLVLEAGGCPPLESNLAGYFTLMPRSIWDYQMDISNNGYASQNVQTQGGATVGKMLGGSGSLNHMMMIPPIPEDYDHWATAANDSSWAFTNFVKYFKKGANVTDEGVQMQNETWVGTDGPTKLTRQQSSLMDEAIAGHVEIGLPYKNDSIGLCVNSPLFAIGDNLRQCGNVAYLSKIKNDNVTFLTNAYVTKVLFNGTKATGVQFTYDGTSYNVSASTAVILSAGAIKTPQLLMLSGVGNKTALSEFGIDVVLDLPEVGLNFRDHVAAPFALSLGNTTTNSIADPHMFPAPMITSYDALNKSQSQPELQNIMLYFSTNSSGMLQLTTYGFKFLDAIVNTWSEKNMQSDMILCISNLLHPLSSGSIRLNSTNATDQPIIDPGLMKNSTDLDTFAELLVQYVEPLLNSSAYQKLGAEFVDLGLCNGTTKFSLDFFKCYCLEMSSIMWHFGGSCSMGKVVDSTLNVYNTTNLKIIDASIIPYLTSGNIGFTVQALAEKGADILKSEF